MQQNVEIKKKPWKNTMIGGEEDGEREKKEEEEREEHWKFVEVECESAKEFEE